MQAIQVQKWWTTKIQQNKNCVTMHASNKLCWCKIYILLHAFFTKNPKLGIIEVETSTRPLQTVRSFHLWPAATVSVFFPGHGGKLETQEWAEMGTIVVKSNIQTYHGLLEWHIRWVWKHFLLDTSAFRWICNGLKWQYMKQGVGELHMEPWLVDSL